MSFASCVPMTGHPASPLVTNDRLSKRLLQSAFNPDSLFVDTGMSTTKSQQGSSIDPIPFPYPSADSQLSDTTHSLLLPPSVSDFHSGCPTSPCSPASWSRSPARHGPTFSPQTMVVDAQDVEFLRKSSTSHFRNLALNVESSCDSHLHLPGVTEDREDVSGMSGRLRLQKDVQSHLASRNWMDSQRKHLQAYEYLCHIGEAKEWIEDCIDEQIPSVVLLEEALRNGVILAKLTRVFAPELVKKLIEAPKLQFRHTDNINYFFNFLDKVGMPAVCFFFFFFSSCISMRLIFLTLYLALYI